MTTVKGAVRLYLNTHPRATASEISWQRGIPIRLVRMALKSIEKEREETDRYEITEAGRAYLSTL